MCFNLSFFFVIWLFTSSYCFYLYFLHIWHICSFVGPSNVCALHWLVQPGGVIIMFIYIAHQRLTLVEKYCGWKKTPKRYDRGGKTMQLAGSSLQILNNLCLKCIHCWPGRFLSRSQLDYNSAQTLYSLVYIAPLIQG